MAKMQKEGRSAKMVPASGRRSVENQRKRLPASPRDTAPSQVSRIEAKSQTKGRVIADGTTVNNNATVNQQIVVHGDALFSRGPDAERTSPGDYDGVLTKRAQAKIKSLGGQCPTPRTAVDALLTRVGSNRATVNIIVAPPRCGKSQLINDLISRAPDCPRTFVQQLNARDAPLAETVQEFHIQGDIASPPFIRFLKARASEKKPLLVFIDAQATSNEMMELVSFVAEDPDSNTHVFIALPLQGAIDLLFRDYEPRLTPNSAIAIFELGAFTDSELRNVYPEVDLQQANAPFGRLIRWPGLRSAIRRVPSFVDALRSWFQYDCPEPVKDALKILGSELVRNSTWNAQQLPESFVTTHRDDLAILREHGFVIVIPSKKSGIGSYGFSAVEIGVYALLRHIFEATSHQARAAAMDGIVAHWKQTSSEQEIAALAAILPAFLTDNNSSPLDKIVRRMLWISFGSSVLETTSRSALFAEYESVVDSHVVASKEMILRNVPSELLKRALLKFRDRVGLMPDFAELEQRLRHSLRFFDGINNQILKSNFTIEQWEDKGHLAKFGRTELLDALYLLSKGDFSWLPLGADKAAIIRVARAISKQAKPHRKGFPIDSRHPYLAKIITRRYPEDLALILKTNRGNLVSISLKSKHIAKLANLVIDAYKGGDWNPLSSCFVYGDMMAIDLRTLLRNAFLEFGDLASFVRVFINGGQGRFCAWPQSARARVIHRILSPDCNLAGVVACLHDGPLRVIRDKHSSEFARIVERVWATGAPRPILRVIANGFPDTMGRNAADIRKLIAQLNTYSLCTAISMREFFDTLLPTVSIPIASSADLTIPGESVTAGAELTLEALGLLQLKNKHLVDDARWASFLMERRLEMKMFVRFAPTFEAPNISWSVERCKAYIQASIRDGIQQGKQVELDRILRTALLNIHESQFNGIYLRVAVAMVSEAGAEYRMSVARRLILSGFDLWEVPTAGYACPMLNVLLAEVDNALSVGERDTWVKWMRRHYRWLRQLPLFRMYSMIEFRQVDAAQTAFFELRFDGTAKLSEFLLPYVDLLFRSPMNDAEGFARRLLEAIEECDEGLSEFGKRYPEELERLQAFLPRPIQRSEPKVTVDDVLHAFANAIGVIPPLPTSLRQWDGVAPPRSMLSPVGDEGYKSYTVEEFRNSLTGG